MIEFTTCLYNSGFNDSGPWPPIETMDYLTLVGVVNYAEKKESKKLVRSRKIYPHPAYVDEWDITYDDVAIIEVFFIHQG